MDQLWVSPCINKYLKALKGLTLYHLGSVATLWWFKLWFYCTHSSILFSESGVGISFGIFSLDQQHPMRGGCRPELCLSSQGVVALKIHLNLSLLVPLILYTEHFFPAPSGRSITAPYNLSFSIFFPAGCSHLNRIIEIFLSQCMHSFLNYSIIY